MKATLEFNLPEEQYQFDCATKGISMDMAITEMQEEFRKMIKYNEWSDIQYKMLEELRDKFNEIVQSNNANIRVDY
jgi:hypothetical protein